LTQQDFSNYIASMDAELAALEDKIRQATSLCLRLRNENRDLRQQLVALESDRKQLSEKIDHARNRLEGLLQRIPE
jgi:cell division protein ZapB